MLLISRIGAWSKRYERPILIAILVATCVASLIYSFSFRIDPSVDAAAYDSFGWQLAQGKGYDVRSAIGRPGPGYEFFLAFLYVLFGHSYPAVWIAQAILLAATAFFVFFITKYVFREAWHPAMGHAAALFVGLSPDLITISGMLLTETLVLFLLATTILLFFIYEEKRVRAFVPLLAIAVASTALTRGNLILLAVPIAVWFFLKHEWKRGLLFVLILFAALVPWTVRNYLVHGKIKPFDGSPGILYVGNRPGASGELDIGFPLPPGVDHERMSQVQYDDALGRAGMQYILGHPFEFIRLSLIRASIYFSAARPFGWWGYLHGWAKRITLLSSALYAVLLFLFGGLGIAWALRKHQSRSATERAWYLAAFSSIMPLAVLALVVETRYRFPLYPLLAVFAGAGLVAWFRERKTLLAPLITIAALLMANAAFDVIRNWGRIFERLTHL